MSGVCAGSSPVGSLYISGVQHTTLEVGLATALPELFRHPHDVFFPDSIFLNIWDETVDRPGEMTFHRHCTRTSHSQRPIRIEVVEFEFSGHLDSERFGFTHTIQTAIKRIHCQPKNALSGAFFWY